MITNAFSHDNDILKLLEYTIDAKGILLKFQS